MADSKGSSNIKGVMYVGKHALLPPKIPFSSNSPSYVEYLPTNAIGTKAVQRPKEGNSHHQRTLSETFVIEEQPSWLDDLLNEPDTPVCRGSHRRSSSDSFAYMDVANASNVDYLASDGYGNRIFIPTWHPQDFNYCKQSSFYANTNTTDSKNRAWDSSLKTTSHPYGNSSPRETTGSRSPVSLSVMPEADVLPSSVSEKNARVDSSQCDPKTSSEVKDGVQSQSYASDNDTKRAKQQFAQRSRVRKLQYIAELERNVQALQAEGSEFSAELEFLNQQNLILTMENKALKQRVESLAQEHLIKCLEHEVLEREIGRLRALYQQQQQQQHQHQPQPQSSASHRRSKSRDLESQFSNLSLKQKSANSSRDPVTGPLRT